MCGRGGRAAQLLDSASELRRLASGPQGTPQPGLAWPGYFPPSFLGVLGDFLLLVFFLADFFGGVSCAKVTATQPRASERPSINVISFFTGVPPSARVASQPSGEEDSRFPEGCNCLLYTS